MIIDEQNLTFEGLQVIGTKLSGFTGIFTKEQLEELVRNAKVATQNGDLWAAIRYANYYATHPRFLSFSVIKITGLPASVDEMVATIFEIQETRKFHLWPKSDIEIGGMPMNALEGSLLLWDSFYFVPPQTV